MHARCLTILSLISLHTTSAPSRAIAMAQLTLKAHGMQLTHIVTSIVRRLRCNRCSQVFPEGKTAINQWLSQPCGPDQILLTVGTARPARSHCDRVELGNHPIHASHTMMVPRGRSFCRKCGAYGIKRALLLSQVCGVYFDRADKGQKRLAEAQRSIV